MTRSRTPHRILLLRYSALGDVVASTAALRWLRVRFPEATVDALTAAPFVGLLRAPDREVFALNRRRPRPLELARLTRILRARRYDLVVDLQGKLTSRFLARAAGAARLLGPPPRHGNILSRYQAVLAPLGCESLPEPKLESYPASTVADPDAGFIALVPGAAHETKRWGAARFAELAVRLHAAGRSVVVTGGPGDEAEVEAVIRQARRSAAAVASRVSEVDALGLAKILNRAAMVVAGDTGPLHLARALGRPALGLYGPTDPRVWAPPGAGVVWRAPACAPCSRHGHKPCSEARRVCLDDLEPAEVAGRALRLLADHPDGAGSSTPDGESTPDGDRYAA